MADINGILLHDSIHMLSSLRLAANLQIKFFPALAARYFDLFTKGNGGCQVSRRSGKLDRGQLFSAKAIFLWE